MAVEKAYRAALKRVKKPAKVLGLKSAPIGSAPIGLRWKRKTAPVVYHVPKQRCSHSMLHSFSVTMHYWQNSEIRELLMIHAEEEVHRQVSGTVRDTVVHKNIAVMLRQRGYDRMPRQVINKLGTLKDKNNRSGMGHVDWPFYDLCQNIYGNSALAWSWVHGAMAGSSAASTLSLVLSDPLAEDNNNNHNNSNTNP